MIFLVSKNIWPEFLQNSWKNCWYLLLYSTTLEEVLMNSFFKNGNIRERRILFSCKSRWLCLKFNFFKEFDPIELLFYSWKLRHSFINIAVNSHLKKKLMAFSEIQFNKEIKLFKEFYPIVLLFSFLSWTMLSKLHFQRPPFVHDFQRSTVDIYFL